jgi:hypothetical protein
MSHGAQERIGWRHILPIPKTSGAVGMITRLRYPKGYQFFDSNGAPLALASLSYFAAGTTTLQDTYSDTAGTVPNTNPVVLDGAGRLDGDVYLGSAADYKEVLTAGSAAVPPWPDDNIPRATLPDWNAASGPSQILNKPALAAVALSGSYKDLSNVPPTQFPFAGDSGSGGTAGLVPAPAAGNALANMFLSASGNWATPPGSPVSINLVTSAATASGTTLTFASVPPSIAVGMLVTDTTHSSVIPAGTTVVSATSTAVTLSAAVTGSGVASGDTINFFGSPSLVTNLSIFESANSVSIGSSSGSGITIPAATHSAAGVLDSARAAKIDSLATVAVSGSYTDLANKLGPFAGDSGSGGVMGLVPAPAAGTAAAGKFLKADGTWAVPSGGSGGFTLPAATANVLGGVKIGANVTAAPDGTISVTAPVNPDWNAPGGLAQILNKPALGTAAAMNVPIAATNVSGIPASLASQNLDNIARLGVGTTDTGNKLSVNGPASLFSNSGDVRVTMSKGSATNTAAFNFQDNFSTRVQFGLLGNDSFTISSSPDGSTFNIGLVISPAGSASVGGTFTLASFTVSGLPSAATAGAGTMAWVTDATQTFTSANFGATVTGGGTHGARVISNGTNWIIA